jgi:hypothetical protein
LEPFLNLTSYCIFVKASSKIYPPVTAGEYGPVAFFGEEKHKDAFES